MRTLASFTAPTPVSRAAAATQQRSPWHSPVPYLFGGLAAMLGLIAFALLILACSYWKLSDRADNNNNNNNNNSNGDQNGDRDVESGEKDQEGDAAKAVKVFEEKFLVIMAGDVKPTFLATPVFTKAPAFADGQEINRNGEPGKTEIGEKVKEVTDQDSGRNQESQRDQEQN